MPNDAFNPQSVPSPSSLLGAENSVFEVSEQGQFKSKKIKITPDGKIIGVNVESLTIQQSAQRYMQHKSNT
ncbi:MAG: hypothetical protein ACKO37_05025 [Vampirovibrionales bacterium]